MGKVKGLTHIAQSSNLRKQRQSIARKTRTDFEQETNQSNERIPDTIANKTKLEAAFKSPRIPVSKSPDQNTMGVPQV